MRKIILGLILGVAVAAGGAIAASSPTPVRQNGMNFGPYCISLKSGVIRAVSTAQNCRMGEVRVLHSRMSTLDAAGGVAAQSAAGPAGVRGEAGPGGEAGAPGAKGDTGATGAKGDLGATGAKGDTGATGAKGDAGATGETGANGDTGPTGAKGDTGPQGAPGVSSVAAVSSDETCKFGGWLITFADDLTAAVCHGSPGLDGAAGDKGDRGDTGPAGPKGDTGGNGPAGAPGQNGAPGDNGAPGLSAYQLWLEAGNTGTVGDYLQSLKGDTGPGGPKGDKGANGPAGAPGQNGAPGENGAPGLSAYQLWLAAGNTGTVGDYLQSLKGDKGEQGETGPQGPPVSIDSATICVSNSNGNIKWGGGGGATPCSVNETAYHVAVLP